MGNIGGIARWAIADRRGDLRYGLPLSLGITQDSWISDLRNFTKIRFRQETQPLVHRKRAHQEDRRSKTPSAARFFHHGRRGLMKSLKNKQEYTDSEISRRHRGS